MLGKLFQKLFIKKKRMPIVTWEEHLKQLRAGMTPEELEERRIRAEKQREETKRRMEQIRIEVAALEKEILEESGYTSAKGLKLFEIGREIPWGPSWEGCWAFGKDEDEAIRNYKKRFETNKGDRFEGWSKSCYDNELVFKERGLAFSARDEEMNKYLKPRT